MAERGDTPAEQLLHVLATQQLAAKAGFEAGFIDKQGLDAAPEEQKTYLPAAAAHIIYQVIHAKSARLLTEALELVVKQGKLLPPEYLPALLDIADELKLDKKLLRQASGERLQWLAHLRSDWRVYLPLSSDIWKTGTHKQRLRWFAAKREAGIVHSHELWEEIKKTSASDELIAFTQQLKTGLGLADEAKLEALLNHRRKAVRVAAFSLLARIEGAELSQRMQARLALSVQWKKDGFEIQLPKIQADWQRDGFDDFSYAKSGLGKKAGYLCHMMACVPPQHWEQYSTPETFVAQVLKSNWAAALFLALTIASIRFKQEKWAKQLLKALFQHKVLLDVVKANVRAELIQTVAFEEKEKLFLQALQSSERFGQPYLDFSLIIDHEQAFSEAVALAFYQKLRNSVVQRAVNSDHRLRYLLYELPNVAVRTPIALYPKIAGLFPFEVLGDGNSRHYLEEMLQTLDFRYKMHKSLQ